MEKKIDRKMQKKLQQLTSEFKEELITKLLDLDAINKSIIDFNLIHLEGEAIGLDCAELDGDLFDKAGNWNKNAKIDENNPNEFDYLCERIDEILYPNILRKEDEVSFKEKMILCALVYKIHTKLFNRHSSKMNGLIELKSTDEDQSIGALIYKAAHDAVRYAIPYLKTFIMTAEFNWEVKYPKGASSLYKKGPLVKKTPSLFDSIYSFINNFGSSEKNPKEESSLSTLSSNKKNC